MIARIWVCNYGQKVSINRYFLWHPLIDTLPTVCPTECTFLVQAKCCLPYIPTCTLLNHFYPSWITVTAHISGNEVLTFGTQCVFVSFHFIKGGKHHNCLHILFTITVETKFSQFKIFAILLKSNLTLQIFAFLFENKFELIQSFCNIAQVKFELIKFLQCHLSKILLIQNFFKCRLSQT